MTKLESNEVLFNVKSPYFFGLSPEYIDYFWRSISKKTRVNIEATTEKTLYLLACDHEINTSMLSKRLRSRIDGYIVFNERELGMRTIFLFDPTEVLGRKVKQIRYGKRETSATPFNDQPFG